VPLARLMLVCLISALLLFLTIEFGLRQTLGVPRPDRMPLLRVKPDPELGYRPLPCDQHFAYDEFVTLNSLGLRGQELTPRISGQQRIAALGETQLYGLGIPDDFLITAILERSLNAHTEQLGYQVINLAVRAYKLNQQVALLQKLKSPVQPDHALVLFDIHSFGYLDASYYYQQVHHLDWFMLDLSGKPEGVRMVRWHVVQVARRSASIAWVHSLLKRQQARNSLVQRLLEGKKDGGTEAALATVERQLERLAGMLPRGAEAITLAVLPHPRQLYEAFPQERYQSGLTAIAGRLGIGFVDLLPSLSGVFKAKRQLSLAPFDGHWDRHAHRVIGETLASPILSAMRSR
jgi:hypothetical protein